jgi:hypothetical protein
MSGIAKSQSPGHALIIAQAPGYNLLPRHQPQRKLLHDPPGHLKTEIGGTLSTRKAGADAPL